MFILIWFLFIFAVLVARCVYLILTVPKRSLSEIRKSKLKTMIVIGSGGHTTEMLRIVKQLNHNRFSPRIYIVASSDDKSLLKVDEVEKIPSTYRIYKIPRSRKVHQSYISSIFTTLYSILYAVPIVFLNKPDLILCNGPGTCIPICGLAFLMRLMYLSNNAIIYIESICRVKTLSLSGKILIYFADRIIVQWPELQRSYPRTTFIGDVEL